MTFKRGGSKPEGSGRKKGTPNKRTQDAISLSQKLGVDPLEILLLIAKGDWSALGYSSPKTQRLTRNGDSVDVERIELDHRLQAAKEACKYIYPARKAIELKGDDDGPAPVFTISLTKPGDEPG